MFFKKKVDGEDDDYSVVDYVKCCECRHIIEKVDAQVVIKDTDFIYYCPEHKKKYNKICTVAGTKLSKSGLSMEIFYSRRYYMIVPQHEIEVDKNGRKIKLKK